MPSDLKAPIGVVGSGSFGTAVANLLAENNDVFLYTRREEIKEQIIEQRQNAGQQVHVRVMPTTSLEEVAEKCLVIFPTVPSKNFRAMMVQFSPHLRPDHILIHGTKGLDLRYPDKIPEEKRTIDRASIHTMSEVIREESVVIRVGCIAGPNLSLELAHKQPAATVIASKFDEVIQIGIHALRSHRFQVYGSHDLVGAELAGVLKNTIAIASGILSGLELGENARALLITKGLGEMIRLGVAIGSDMRAFLGLAGVGDLIATCSSKLSRNFQVGFRIAKEETLQQILDSMEEVAEGVNTTTIAYHLGKTYKVRTPIIDTLYQVLQEGLTPRLALQKLMENPFDQDVDFI